MRRHCKVCSKIYELCTSRRCKLYYPSLLHTVFRVIEHCSSINKTMKNVKGVFHSFALQPLDKKWVWKSCIREYFCANGGWFFYNVNRSHEIVDNVIPKREPIYYHFSLCRTSMCDGNVLSGLSSFLLITSNWVNLLKMSTLPEFSGKRHFVFLQMCNLYQNRFSKIILCICIRE